MFSQLRRCGVRRDRVQINHADALSAKIYRLEPSAIRITVAALLGHTIQNATKRGTLQQPKIGRSAFIMRDPISTVNVTVCWSTSLVRYPESFGNLGSVASVFV
jgi:hypothetical protein